MPAVGFGRGSQRLPGPLKLAERNARRQGVWNWLLPEPGAISRGTRADNDRRAWGRGCYIRKKWARLEMAPLGQQNRESSPFRDGARPCLYSLLGATSSPAWHTTAIPNIEVYVAMDESSIKWMRRIGPLVPPPVGIPAGKESPTPFCDVSCSIRSSLRNHPPQGSLWGLRFTTTAANRLQPTLTTPQSLSFNSPDRSGLPGKKPWPAKPSRVSALQQRPSAPTSFSQFRKRASAGRTTP